MKFFDYKFLILLGLTLVVYFIYKEVEYLRGKVNKIENEINQKKLSNESAPKQVETVNNPILQVTNAPKQNLQLPNVSNQTLQIPINNHILQLPNISNQTLQIPANKNTTPAKSPEKIINLDLVSQSNNSIALKQESTTSSEDEDQDVNTTTELQSESSKHLAIYSNDNEQFDSAQNSLIDSVEAAKFNTENPDLKLTMDNIINDLTSDSEKSNKSKQEAIDEIIMEKEKQLSEMSPKSENKIQISEVELNEKKLSDIKDIAIKLGITMSKKINGQQKQKTKQDLISEIILK
jgi:hypothetical protein